MAGIEGPARSQNPGAGLLIPLYIYPAPGAWQPLISAKAAHPDVNVIAIVNPGSGPGTRIDSNYVGGISALQTAGITLLEYVPTFYGKRAYADVKSDIDAYSKLYGPVFSGLFIDEMGRTDAAYYGAIRSYAKQRGLNQTIANPGTDVPENYVGQTCDVLVIYENVGNPSVNFLGGWHSAFPKQNWAFIAHHVPILDRSLISQAKDSVGLMYVTDANYHSFPQYLGELFSLL